MITHPFPPLFDKNSRVLILGSFPSVKSREQSFFYGHPRNRFWRVAAAVFNSPVPRTIKEKTDFALSHNLALWDVIASCDITGSSDSSIKNVTANDLSPILKNSAVRRIFVNGKTAEKYYNMFTKEKLGIKAVCLPSTSPANAAWTFEKLVKAWSVIAEDF